MVKPFYTVIALSTGRFTIRYVIPPDWRIQETPRHYDDPGEAKREFQATQPQFRAVAPLSKNAFERRIRQHNQEMEKWKRWTSAS
jgi:hypothetical protein